MYTTRQLLGAYANPPPSSTASSRAKDTLPVITKEEVGNIMEGSYKAKKEKPRAVPPPPPSPLELLRTQALTASSERIKTDNELLDWRKKQEVQRSNMRMNEALERVEMQKQVEQRQAEKRNKAHQEMMEERRRIEMEIKQRQQQEQKKRKETRKAKIREGEELRDLIAEREAWRHRVAQERIKEEQATCEADLKALKDEFVSEMVKKKRQQELESLQRRMEMLERQRRTREAKLREKQEQEEEAARLARAIELSDTMTRLKKEKAQAVGKEILEQINVKKDQDRKAREQQREGTSPTPSLPGMRATPPSTAATSGRLRTTANIGPAAYTDHYGRTLYRWGATV